MSSVRSRKGSVLCTGIILKVRCAPFAGCTGNRGFFKRNFFIFDSFLLEIKKRQQEATKNNRMRQG